MHRALAAGLLCLSCAATAQQRMELSKTQQDAVLFTLETAPGTSIFEAETFLHVGQGKRAACEADVRSRECQVLAQLLDEMRSRLTRRALKARAAARAAQRPQ